MPALIETAEEFFERQIFSIFRDKLGDVIRKQDREIGTKPLHVYFAQLLNHYETDLSKWLGLHAKHNPQQHKTGNIKVCRQLLDNIRDHCVGIEFEKPKQWEGLDSVRFDVADLVQRLLGFSAFRLNERSNTIYYEAILSDVVSDHQLKEIKASALIPFGMGSIGFLTRSRANLCAWNTDEDLRGTVAIEDLILGNKSFMAEVIESPVEEGEETKRIEGMVAAFFPIHEAFNNQHVSAAESPVFQIFDEIMKEHRESIRLFWAYRSRSRVVTSFQNMLNRPKEHFQERDIESPEWWKKSVLQTLVGDRIAGKSETNALGLTLATAWKVDEQDPNHFSLVGAQMDEAYYFDRLEHVVATTAFVPEWKSQRQLRLEEYIKALDKRLDPEAGRDGVQTLKEMARVAIDEDTPDHPFVQKDRADNGLEDRTSERKSGSEYYHGNLLIDSFDDHIHNSAKGSLTVLLIPLVAPPPKKKWQDGPSPYRCYGVLRLLYTTEKLSQIKKNLADNYENHIPSITWPLAWLEWAGQAARDIESDARSRKERNYENKKGSYLGIMKTLDGLAKSYIGSIEAHLFRVDANSVTPEKSLTSLFSLLQNVLEGTQFKDLQDKAVGELGSFPNASELQEKKAQLHKALDELSSVIDWKGESRGGWAVYIRKHGWELQPGATFHAFTSAARPQQLLAAYGADEGGITRSPMWWRCRPLAQEFVSPSTQQVIRRLVDLAWFDTASGKSSTIELGVESLVFRNYRDADSRTLPGGLMLSSPSIVEKGEQLPLRFCHVLRFPDDDADGNLRHWDEMAVLLSTHDLTKYLPTKVSEDPLDQLWGDIEKGEEDRESLHVLETRWIRTANGVALEREMGHLDSGLIQQIYWDMPDHHFQHYVSQHLIEDIAKHKPPECGLLVSLEDPYNTEQEKYLSTLTKLQQPVENQVFKVFIEGLAFRFVYVVVIEVNEQPAYLLHLYSAYRDPDPKNRRANQFLDEANLQLIRIVKNLLENQIRLARNASKSAADRVVVIQQRGLGHFLKNVVSRLGETQGTIGEEILRSIRSGAAISPKAFLYNNAQMAAFQLTEMYQILRQHALDEAYAWRKGTQSNPQVSLSTAAEILVSAFDAIPTLRTMHLLHLLARGGVVLAIQEVGEGDEPLLLQLNNGIDALKEQCTKLVIRRSEKKEVVFKPFPPNLLSQLQKTVYVAAAPRFEITGDTNSRLRFSESQARHFLTAVLEIFDNASKYEKSHIQVALLPSRGTILFLTVSDWDERYLLGGTMWDAEMLIDSLADYPRHKEGVGMQIIRHSLSALHPGVQYKVARINDLGSASANINSGDYLYKDRHGPQLFCSAIVFPSHDQFTSE